jgi:hypothetical protein
VEKRKVKTCQKKSTVVEKPMTGSSHDSPAATALARRNAQGKNIGWAQIDASAQATST